MQRELAVRDFEAALFMASRPDPINGYLNFTRDDVLRELHGYNLACWCSLDPEDGPCHADVLLSIANAMEEIEIIENINTNKHGSPNG